MGTFIVGVAGGTGSGKTTLARALAASLPSDRVTIVEHDWYYRDRRDLAPEARAQLNFDHPESLETSLLVEHLHDLRCGRPVDAPTYDFKTHARTGQTRTLLPTPVIIVEGILAFVDEDLRAQFDAKIFVDTDADIRVMRRIRRDIEQRGRTFQSIREQYYATVRPMHLLFVEPSKRWADLIVPEGGDQYVVLDLLVHKLKHVLAMHADHGAVRPNLMRRDHDVGGIA